VTHRWGLKSVAENGEVGSRPWLGWQQACEESCKRWKAWIERADAGACPGNDVFLLSVLVVRFQDWEAPKKRVGANQWGQLGKETWIFLRLEVDMTGITKESRNKDLTPADLCASCKSAFMRNRQWWRTCNGWTNLETTWINELLTYKLRHLFLTH
jgi:hypothetical protein